MAGDVRFSWRALLIGWLAAGVAAAIANAIYYLLIGLPLADGTVVAPQPPDMAFLPVPIVAVIVASIMYFLFAAIVYGAVVRFAPGNSTMIYMVIVVIALIVSFFFPGNYFNPEWEQSSRIALGLTHIIAAAVGVPVLLSVYRRVATS